MANLYELKGSFLQLQEMLEDVEMDKQTVLDTMESINFEIEEKAQGYAMIIKNLSSDANGLKAEEERLSTIRKAVEGRIDTLKRNLEQSMIELGKTKFKTPLFSFNVQKNAPSLEITDESFVPIIFYKEVAPTLDRKALLNAIKGGQIFKGVGMKQTESLRIR